MLKQAETSHYQKGLNTKIIHRGTDKNWYRLLSYIWG